MAKTTAALILFLTGLTILLGYNYFARPFADWGVETLEEIEEIDEQEPVLTGADLAKQLVASMSPQEKIWQLIAVPVVLGDLEADDLVAELEEGLGVAPRVVTIFGSEVSVEQVRQLDQVLSEKLSQPAWLLVDHEGGSVLRLSGEGFTTLPSWQEQCQLQELELYELWTQVASELSAAGIDVVLAPMVDFSQNHPVLRSRVCASDPDRVVEQSLVMAETVRSVGILPVFKHFPGIGQTTVDLHFRSENITVGLEEANVYRSLLAAIPRPAVMTAHVGVSNQFPDLPCSLSADCVGELAAVVDQILIVTDALEMEAALESGEERLSLEEASARALMAGNHLLIYGPQVSVSELKRVHADLLERYQENPQFAERVDQAVIRVVEYRLL